MPGRLRDAALELGDRNPLGHHITNVIIINASPVEATTRCKAIVVLADGRCGTATYLDTLRNDDRRWRICHRIVKPRRASLGGAHEQQQTSA